MVEICSYKDTIMIALLRVDEMVIISPDESGGYIGFTSVASPPPYVLTCVRDNSKMISRISFKLGTHMYLCQERIPILR